MPKHKTPMNNTQNISRFSDLMSKRAAERMLKEASHATPILPNGGSRLWASLSRTLVEGRANAKGSVYVVNIFDRASPWILPRYQKTFTNESLRVVTADAVGWIEDRTNELHWMNNDVHTAIVSIQPYCAHST